ncbi:hypothetical protein EGW08_007383 [Elysia chlorotica]|uniref:2-oxoglutarate and iron-dependent oxygenase JMJD4 n=1 Tax=Elysia chlorotica TaxID=188477 RepID=A0A3S1HRT4_ELYCH|nr:hypothetical protein EGW08_007383 [Elysia chlorotica]
MLQVPEILDSSVNLLPDETTAAASYPGVVYLSELPSHDELFRSIFLKNQLCIVGPQLTAGWQSRQLWVSEDGTPDFDYIRKNFGDAVGPVADCNGEEFSAHPKTSMKVAEFIYYWRQYKAEGYPSTTRCLYLKDWHFSKRFPTYRAYTTPTFLCSDWLNEFYDTAGSELGGEDDYRFVYMGPKGSWTPFHSDVLRSYSWSANICGRKKWIFFPPGVEEMLKDRHGQLIFDLRSDDLGDITKYPEAWRAVEQAIVVIQNPGEIVFVPSGWHHQVFNLEDAISINHNWMNGCSIHHTWEYLKTHLTAVQREIADCRGMDGWENQCQMILKADAGLDFAGFYTFMTTIARNRLLTLQEFLKEKKNSPTFSLLKSNIRSGVQGNQEENASGSEEVKNQLSDKSVKSTKYWNYSLPSLWGKKIKKDGKVSVKDNEFYDKSLGLEKVVIVVSELGLFYLELSGHSSISWMILKADAGIDFAGFYTFMTTIARNRLLTLQEFLKEKKNSPTFSLLKSNIRSGVQGNQEENASGSEEVKNQLSDKSVKSTKYWNYSLPSLWGKKTKKDGKVPVKDNQVSHFGILHQGHSFLSRAQGKLFGYFRGKVGKVNVQKSKPEKMEFQQSKFLGCHKSDSQNSYPEAKPGKGVFIKKKAKHSMGRSSPLKSEDSNKTRGLFSDKVHQNQTQPTGLNLLEKSDSNRCYGNPGNVCVTQSLKKFNHFPQFEDIEDSSSCSVEASLSRRISNDSQADYQFSPGNNNHFPWFSVLKHNTSASIPASSREGIRKVSKAPPSVYSGAAASPKEETPKVSQASSSVYSGAAASPKEETPKVSKASSSVYSGAAASPKEETPKVSKASSSVYSGAAASPKEETPKVSKAPPSVYSGAGDKLRQSFKPFGRETVEISAVYLKKAWDTISSDVLPRLLVPESPEDEDLSERFTFEEEPDLEPLYEQEPEEGNKYEIEPEVEFVYEDEPISFWQDPFSKYFLGSFTTKKHVETARTDSINKTAPPGEVCVNILSSPETVSTDNAVSTRNIACDFRLSRDTSTSRPKSMNIEKSVSVNTPNSINKTSLKNLVTGEPTPVQNELVSRFSSAQNTSHVSGLDTASTSSPAKGGSTSVSSPLSTAASSTEHVTPQTTSYAGTPPGHQGTIIDSAVTKVLASSAGSGGLNSGLGPTNQPNSNEQTPLSNSSLNSPTEMNSQGTNTPQLYFSGNGKLLSALSTNELNSSENVSDGKLNLSKNNFDYGQIFSQESHEHEESEPIIGVYPSGSMSEDTESLSVSDQRVTQTITNDTPSLEKAGPSTEQHEILQSVWSHRDDSSTIMCCVCFKMFGSDSQSSTDNSKNVSNLNSLVNINIHATLDCANTKIVCWECYSQKLCQEPQSQENMHDELKGMSAESLAGAGYQKLNSILRLNQTGHMKTEVRASHCVYTLILCFTRTL